MVKSQEEMIEVGGIRGKIKEENICSSCGVFLSSGRIVLKGKAEDGKEVVFCNHFCQAKYVFDKGVPVLTETRVNNKI